MKKSNMIKRDSLIKFMEDYQDSLPKSDYMMHNIFAIEKAIDLVNMYEGKFVQVPEWFDVWFKKMKEYNKDKDIENKVFYHLAKALVYDYDEYKTKTSEPILLETEIQEISKDLYKYLDASRFGYTISEKLYYVKSNGYFILWKKSKNNIALCKDKVKEINSDCYKLTEKEIKDFDERYWSFATLVEDEALIL